MHRIVFAFSVCLFFVCLFCLLYGISWNICFPCGSDGKESMWETWVWSLSQEDPLEKEMATHSLILAWEIPWTKEPGGLQSMGSQGVRHDQVINIHIPWKKKKINNCIYNSLIRQKGPESITMSFILIFFNGLFLLHILNIFVLIQVA